MLACRMSQTMLCMSYNKQKLCCIIGAHMPQAGYICCLAGSVLQATIHMIRTILFV